MHGFIRRRVLFTVPDSGACRHPLHITGTNYRTIPHAVFVFEFAFENIGDDFHVSMAMLAKAPACSNEVFVNNTQTPKAQVAWIVVLIERESVIGVQPAMVEVTALV